MKTLSLNQELKVNVYHDKPLTLHMQKDGSSKTYRQTFSSVFISGIGKFVNLTEDDIVLKTDADDILIPNHGSCNWSRKTVTVSSGNGFTDGYVELPPFQHKVYWILPKEVSQERGVTWFLNREDVICPKRGRIYSSTERLPSNEWKFTLLRH